MIKRPKGSDTEQEVLKMQKEFLMEKTKNANFQPAAKVVKLSKPSKFAQSRMEMLKRSTESIPKATETDILGEKQLGTGYSCIIGDIVERSDRDCEQISVDIEMEEPGEAFPRVHRIEKMIKSAQLSTTKMSLFALSQKKRTKNDMPMDATPSLNHIPFGESSCILRNDGNNAIHMENVEFLKKLSEEDILSEQQNLLGTMDPSLVNFLRQKRQAKLERIPENKPTSVVDKNMPDVKATAELGSSSVSTIPNLHIFQHDDIKKWLHFDVVETAKLEWMRDLPAYMPELKTGEPYEARFDWKGVLLPFSDEKVKNTSTDLFLHGDDAHRPGYTLQELFRLARSTVMQQRTSALGAIGGILSIYNQGYYDNILELPISKIFFLLRYAFDDNAPAMLEASSKALSILFYKQTEEILLDLTFDCSNDLIEPTLQITDNDSQNDTEAELDKKFAKMNLKSNKAFQTRISDEDENSVSSMNDFHLAETDLIKCLLRTNILQRISYICSVLNFETSTTSNCIKILIRIARTGSDAVDSIITHEELMDNIFQLFGHNPLSNEARMHNASKVLILKLWRIIMGYGVKYAEKLRSYGIDAALKTCIYLQENGITIQAVNAQIEANRCAKVLICTTKSNEFYNDLVPALQYTLEWIYQFLIFEKPDQFIFRQCASALVSLISVSSTCCDLFPKLPMCFSKWFLVASKQSVEEISQIVLLATCVNSVEKSTSNYVEFLDTYFMVFLNLKSYLALSESLIQTSALLSKNERRTNIHEPLPDLNSITLSSKNLPALIITEKCAIFLFESLVRLTNNKYFKDHEERVTSLLLSDGLKLYIEALSKQINTKFNTNWFARNEIQFCIELLKSSTIRNAIDKNILLNLTYKIITCLGDYQLNDLLFLLNNVIFNVEYYLHKAIFRQTNLNNWNTVYVKIFIQKYLIRNNSRNQHLAWNYNSEPILNCDWPCVMVEDMYEASNAGRVMSMPEQDIIKTTFSFLSLLNVNQIDLLKPTEQLIYTMMAFLGKDCTFLEEEISSLLSTFVKNSFTKSSTFNLDDKFRDHISFEHLYIALLDQFQGTSYGNKTFGLLVMAPLAQQHNIKWRQMVWSEHAAVLRFITCRETDLIGSIDAYLQPVETDQTLLKSYYQAIHSNELIPDSVPSKIATHHVKAYKSILEKTKLSE